MVNNLTDRIGPPIKRELSYVLFRSPQASIDSPLERGPSRRRRDRGVPPCSADESRSPAFDFVSVHSTTTPPRAYSCCEDCARLVPYLGLYGRNCFFIRTVLSHPVPLLAGHPSPLHACLRTEGICCSPAASDYELTASLISTNSATASQSPSFALPTFLRRSS